MKRVVFERIIILLVLFLASSCFAGIQGDITGDCSVDFEDIYVMSEQWLQEGDGEVGLFSHWKFDADCGAAAYDSVSGIYTAINNAIWVDGMFGSALYFNGEGSKIDIPAIELFSNYSISFWAKKVANSYVIATPYSAMVFGDDSVNTDCFYMLENIEAKFRNSDSNTAVWDTDKDLAGRWRFVTLVAGYDEIELFLDAVPQGKRSIDPHIKISQIGAGHTIDAYDFKGIIDDFRIYDRKLNIEEILSLSRRASSVSKRADLDGSLSVDMKDFSMLAKTWGNGVDQPLVISELMASNEETFFDGDGDSPDWIEIFNTSLYDIDLGGWYLTDDKDDKTKWKFPLGTIIKANDYMIVCASGKGAFYYPYICSEGYCHTDFTLDIDGEYLAIVKPNGQVCFEYADKYADQFAEISYGLSPAVVESTKFIEEGDSGSYIVPANSLLGITWTELGFDDSLWTAGEMGIGFDAYGVFDSLIETDIQSQMYAQQTSAYIRIPFYADTVENLDSLILRIKYDDGFVAYLNGIEVARANVDVTNDQTPEYDGIALERLDSEVFEFEEFDISSYKGLLRQGDNVLAIHGLNTDIFNSNFVIVAELSAASRGVDVDGYAYFKEPTPGYSNSEGVAILGPDITDVEHSPIVPIADQDIIVTAKVEELINPVNPASIQLHWRVMYGSESVVPMYDDGAHGDEQAGDGIYGGIIDSNNFSTDDMVRWYVTASDLQGYEARDPAFVNPLSTPQYYGTVALDPFLTSNLPVVYWYTQNTAAVDTRTGTRCSVFYNDEFYDNVFIRLRGGSSAGWYKKNHKIEFNRDHYFKFDPNESRVDEINLNSMFADSSYMRENLSFEVLRDVGVPACIAFPVRIQQNGEFHSIAIAIEQVDSRFLERNGFDDDDPLYKAGLNGSVFDNPYDYEVKNGTYEPMVDFIEGLNLETSELIEQHIFDWVDLAEVINYFTASVVVQETDHSHKNYYLHYKEDMQRWAIYPWDRDLSWGYIWNSGPVLSNNVRCYYADGLRLLAGIENSHKASEMFMRRLRTLMDQWLQPPGTPLAERRVENRLEELQLLLRSEADMDRAKWGWIPPGYVRYEQLLLVDAVDEIMEDYLPGRREFLYNLETMPGAQPADAYISFGAIEYNPSSNNQQQEYIELINSNSYAVDISGWKLTGAVEFTFPQGTVICSNDNMYVSPDVVEFKNRQESPTGGEVHFVQGNYSGHLSNWGETVQLLDENDNFVSQGGYAADPTDAQRYLRITEIMYHPADYNGIDGDEFEYIELQNIGPAALCLDDVSFTDGIEYHFMAEDGVTLGSGEYIVIVKNRSAFASKYDINAINVAPGQYIGNLRNSGEVIKLEDSTNSTILEFEYSDDWYDSTDGLGFSLTIINSSNPNLHSWEDKDSWRPSFSAMGSPGASDVYLIPPDGTIVINEVMSNPVDGSCDWIELHNTSSIPISLEGWFLSDSDDTVADIMKYEMAVGTFIEPYGYIVFTQADHFGNIADPGCNEPFGLGANGDTVYLHSGLGGQLTGYLQDEDFGASEYGVSFGRYKKSTDTFNFVAMESPTPGLENSYPKIGPIIINEIMYNPGDDQDYEYVELYNVSSSAVSLYNYMTSMPWRLSDAIEYEFPSGASIAAGDYIVVVKDYVKFSSYYPTVPTSKIFGPYDGKLSNGGEKIELEMPGDGDNYIRIDRVSYDEEAPWPQWDMVPGHPDPDGGGASISRLYVDCYGNDPNNWSATLPSPGEFNN